MPYVSAYVYAYILSWEEEFRDDLPKFNDLCRSDISVKVFLRFDLNFALEGTDKMDSMMLSAEESCATLNALKGRLSEAGFQFQDSIPTGSYGFAARHPFSGQYVWVEKETVSPIGATDPNRLHAIRIFFGTSRYERKTKIKIWKQLNVPGTGWVVINDVARWAVKKLNEHVDKRDLRNLALLAIHHLIRYKPAPTYQEPLFPTC